ncbi:hypothetical protein QBC45DRAFT_426849 [Copromyces sp. CBS 386.78]|nr:hypothetical protein QBC45DRAFT_426849 [Copromyces sp. CBS 386.78]
MCNLERSKRLWIGLLCCPAAGVCVDCIDWHGIVLTLKDMERMTGHSIRTWLSLQIVGQGLKTSNYIYFWLVNSYTKNMFQSQSFNPEAVSIVMGWGLCVLHRHLALFDYKRYKTEHYTLY